MKSSSKISSSFVAKGFTLIELLVVIAIIGLLASIVTTSMTNVRMKSRDTKRLTDLKQIKSGLDLYFASGNGYPSEATYNAAYSNATLLSCGSIEVLRVPQDPIYPAMQYTYTGVGGVTSGCGQNDLRAQYSISFNMERTPGVTYTMNEDGVFSPALPNF